VFKYPRLNEPDFGTKQYPKPDGAFSVKLVMSLAAAEAFIAKPQKALDGKSLADLHAAAIAEGEAKFKELKVDVRKKLKAVTANPLFKTLYGDDEEPTGEVEFSFAMKYRVPVWKNGEKTDQKTTRNCVIFDAKGNRMKSPPNIWGGTVGKVSFQPSAYWVAGTGAAGLSMNLEAVQIISLVSNGEKTADAYGFGEEDGYTHEEPTAGKDEFSDETPKGEAATSDNEEGDGSSDF
jgi:hypothetical protein